MPRILRREPFTQKHVPEVTPAVHAGDLRSAAVRVRRAFHRAGDLIIEARPAAVGIELSPERYSGALHRRQRYVPAALWETYSPLHGLSVPL